jgi:hypothetical protein
MAHQAFLTNEALALTVLFVLDCLICGFSDLRAGLAEDTRSGFVRSLIREQQLYRGTSLTRNCAPLGPYRRTMSRALWWS